MIDPNTAMEAAKEGATALTKLQEIVQKIFGPTWTRKQADADAYADQQKLNTIRDNPDMEIIYVDGKMHARQYTVEELSQRAQQRMLAEAVRQESNIENVISIAADELSHQNDKASDTPIDEDWITRLFSIVKDVNSEEMQYVWGKILAGEIIAPKSFSLKTLDTLRNISTEDAKRFQKIIPLVVHHANSYFVLSDNEVLLKYESSFLDILSLDECGLINSSGTLSLNLHVSKDKPEFILNDEMLIAIWGNKEESEKVSIGIHTLTRAGKELYKILSHSSSVEYMRELAQQIFKKNKSKIRTSLHKIVSITPNDAALNFQYTKVPIISYSEILSPDKR